MRAVVERLVGQGRATREVARKETAKSSARPKAFVFAFRAPTKTFNLRLRFKKARVERSEIIEVLEGIIRDLRASK
jgi:hypothetical protein